MAIASYRDKDTQALASGLRVKRLQACVNVARRKLRMIESAVQLSDLRAPPGNRLEPLAGNRAGQYSIRINDQWRICFVWKDGAAHGVEIVDYH